MNENQKSTQISQINSTLNVTKRILSMDGNRMRLVFSQIIIFLFAVTICVFSYVPSYVFSYVDENGKFMTPDIFAILGAFFLIVVIIAVIPPMLCGYSNFSLMLSRGEHPEIPMIFCAFSGAKKYFSSFGLCFIKLFRMMLVIMPIIGGLSFLSTYYENIPEAIFIIFCMFAATYVGAYISSFLFFVPYLIISEMKFWDAVKHSCRISHEMRTRITAHTLSHIPSVIAGTLSLGVLALIYTVPRISVSYYVFCDAELNIRQNPKPNDTDKEGNYTNV